MYIYTSIVHKVGSMNKKMLHLFIYKKLTLYKQLKGNIIIYIMMYYNARTIYCL